MDRHDFNHNEIEGIDVDFELAYARGIKGMHAESTGLMADCTECQSAFGIESYKCHVKKFENDIASDKVCDEGSFSWRSCDICGTSLGGDRYIAHALDDSNDIVHLDVCIDCVMFMSNGDLPDRWQKR